ELSLSSLSESSLQQYESPLKRWWLICNQQEIPRYLFNITHILNFLTQEFNRDASYGSINSYKSALSLLLGAEVRQDARIKRFCKSIANIRPPKRKYNGTWDPDVVLKLLNQWPENGDLSLKRLSFKLVILLALTTGHRMQTFSLINVLDVQKQREAIVIKIPATIKTSGPRSTNELIVSHQRPHNKVTALTISRWIKEVLEMCKIDTDIFTAYSTRQASTSAAKRSGICYIL
ncbi:GSCOCG00009243001-RA-CDS, partial [Cotesia congregata]